MTDAGEDAGEDDRVDPPDVSSYLLSFLSVRRQEYEDQYAPAEADVERVLAAMKRHALDLVATGVMPPALADALREFRPGDAAHHTARGLLFGKFTRHRLEFDVAEDVCERLDKLDQRVALVTLLTDLLEGYRPSLTAVKYFRRATTLYLAGYDAEAVIMAGAVLDAALAVRFPDEQLRAAGVGAKVARTYSAGQRAQFALARGLLSAEQGEHIWGGPPSPQRCCPRAAGTRWPASGGAEPARGGAANAVPRRGLWRGTRT